MQSTCRLRGTPPHTPAKMPTEFGEDPRTFFFEGCFAQGPRGSLPQVFELEPGEALSPAPLERGVCRLQFRGGEHVPVTSPRGRTPASSLIFRGEVGTRGLAADSPQGRRGRRIHGGPRW